MPIIARPNRDALSRGLDIYRDTMRPFVLRCLEMVPGAPDEVIRRILPPRQIEDFDRHRQRTADLASAIDVNLFPKLVRAYWGIVFQSQFNGNSVAQEHMTKIKHGPERGGPSASGGSDNRVRQRTSWAHKRPSWTHWCI